MEVGTSVMGDSTVARGSPTVLVVGATGALGAPVPRRLAADGFRVRALVRDDRTDDDVARVVRASARRAGRADGALAAG